MFYLKLTSSTLNLVYPYRVEWNAKLIAVLHCLKGCSVFDDILFSVSISAPLADLCGRTLYDRCVKHRTG